MRYLAVALAAFSLTPTVTFAQNRAPLLLAFDANGSHEAKLYRGWPLILQAQMMNTGETPLKIATNGPWTASVKITIANGDNAVSWPLQPAGSAPASFQMGSMEQMGAVWTLAPEFTRTLASGMYLLRAELDTKTAGTADGWKGVVSSRTISVDVSDEPTTLPAAEQYRKPLLEANYAELRGGADRALAILDAVLAREPRSIAALAQKADVLEAKGQLKEALTVINKAVESAYEKDPDTEHPPVELLERQRDLADKTGLNGLIPADKRVAADAPSTGAPEKSEEQPAAAAKSDVSGATREQDAPGNAPAATPALPPASSTPSEAPVQNAPVPVSPTPPTSPAAAPLDARAQALKQYNDTVSQGDAQFAAGDYFEAVRSYEQAWRVAYNNKLNTDHAALDARLASARKARDEKKKN